MKRRINRDKNLNTVRRWKVGEQTDYEEQAPPGFFDRIGRRAAANAINENRAMNLPVTRLRDGWVVREFPDGKLERISQIKVISNDIYRDRKLVKGATIHVGKKP